jgi:squalene-hopene/tetraprenyl-beta-curcumene cyclase
METTMRTSRRIRKPRAVDFDLTPMIDVTFQLLIFFILAMKFKQERAGMAPDHPAIQRAVRWLESRQNPDGGWGEDLRSYEDPAWRGRGTSTASQTAWALLALLAAGERGAIAERGIEWLTRTQLANGDWDEPEFTGTGFPGDFYIRYHLYRLHFPVMALGRWVRGEA